MDGAWHQVAPLLLSRMSTCVGVCERGSKECECVHVRQAHYAYKWVMVTLKESWSGIEQRKVVKDGGGKMDLYKLRENRPLIVNPRPSGSSPSITSRFLQEQIFECVSHPPTGGFRQHLRRNPRALRVCVCGCVCICVQDETCNLRLSDVLWGWFGVDWHPSLALSHLLYEWSPYFHVLAYFRALTHPIPEQKVLVPRVLRTKFFITPSHKNSRSNDPELQLFLVLPSL